MVAGFGALSCGGSAAPEAEAPSDVTEARQRPEPSDSEHDDSDSSDAADEASTAEADPCADGSCFACGSGQCPAGFYCDESAAGGPGCSWLPECAPKSSCACIDRVLSGCSCNENDGGPRVTCGG